MNSCRPKGKTVATAMSGDAGMPSQANVGLVEYPSTASDPKHCSGKHGNAAGTAQAVCSSSSDLAHHKVKHSSQFASGATPLTSSESTQAANATPLVASAAPQIATFTPLPSSPDSLAVASTPLTSSMTPQGVASSSTAERASEAEDHPAVAAVSEVCLQAQLHHVAV